MQNVIDYLGGPTAVARRVKCKAPSVIGWRKTGIPAERAPALEAATEGRYPVEQICPRVRWHRVPDAAWPWHSAGRPLIDVTRGASLESDAQQEG